MRILLATSELHPWSKTGGLADMVGGLAKALAKAGHRVGVVTPLYSNASERFSELRPLGLPLDLPLGPRLIHGQTWCLEPERGLTIYFIEQPEFYQRSGLYQENGVDYPDNAERFIFLSKAAAYLAQHLPWKPEILHVHDWQVALAALLLRHQRQASSLGSAIRTCLTIHNLAYQGVFPASQYALTNLPWDYFNHNGVEFYGQINLLKAGMVYSDVLTTVSPRYAREITTQEFGCGLDGLLLQRQPVLHGILNGVDYEEWNPSHDPHLAHPYSVSDLSGKTANKRELQKELGLPVDEAIPLFGSVGRMVEQKGAGILLAALEEMLKANIQYIQIGTGTPAFESAFAGLGRRFPSRAATRVGFDQALSHRIEAACDFFLMPSRFEPCGLNQMYSQRYGTIPIVRATGGLDDTVVDIRENPDKADGIKFHEYSAEALVKAIRKALALYAEPALLDHYRRNAMAANFSWHRAVGRYLAAYQETIAS